MSAEKLYQQVKTGKIKMDQLNDEGKNTLKSYMAAKEQKAVTEKYGTNEQRLGSAMGRQKAEEKQKEKSLNNIVYGGTNKLLSSTKKEEPKLGTRLENPINAITKIKDQADNLKQMGLSSTRSAMAAQEAEKAKWDAEHGRNIPLIGDALRGLDKLKEVTKPFADEAQSLYTPGGGLSAINAGTKGVGALVSKLAPKIGNGSGLLPRMATRAAEEAVTGVPLAVGNTLTRNPEASNGELAMSALLGGGGGALIGGGTPLVGKGITSIVNKVKGRGGSISPELTSPSQVMQESVQPNPIARELSPEIKPSPILENPNPIRNTEIPTSNAIDDVEEILQSVQQPRVRDRVVSFLDEQEKAALDRIAKRRSTLSANPLGEWGDHAIVMAAQLGKGTIKAADFTEELVKRFGESVRPHAQVIYRKSKEVLRQQERRASKDGQEAMSFNDSGLGDADTFGSKISTSKAARKVPFKDRWEKLRTQFTDDLGPLEGLEKRVAGSVASAEDSLYKSARMFKGVPEKAAQTVERRLSPIIESVEKSGHTSSDLGKYALAVHAKDVNASGIKSGFTNAEIADVISRFGTTEMEAARKLLIQVNKDMMKELVDNGVVSKELASVLDDRWKNYIPLFRAFDDESVEIGSGLSNALANVASPIKSLKGSERQVIDPLENMVKNIYQSTQAAERNKVASQLRRLNEIDADDKYIRELKKGEEVGRKNVVNVKVNGENVKYEVEPEVYKALLNLDKESSSTLMNWLSKPASLLRAGATLTPEFSLRNPMRDVVQAFVVSKSGFNPITDFGAGLIQTISKGKLYKDWVDNLGAYGNIMSMDRDVHKQALQKVLKEPASKKFVNLVSGKSLIRALRYITDTTESATKVGEYRAALRKGVTPQEAAYRSRDIMDFGRAGTSIRQANKVVAFLNANIQGKSKLIRSIKENPVGTITRAFTAVTVPTIGIFALNKEFANDAQTETIKNAPQWMKNSFWLMAIPGTDVVARIPKPFDLATIFSNLPESALEYTYDNDKEAFDGFLGRAMKDSSLPMQISGLLPLIEGMAGYSFFREGDIVPLREQGLKKSDQYDPTRTSEAGKLLAKGVEKLNGGKGAFGNFASPRVMDNTIQGLTAGLGKYATDAVDSILQGMIPFTSKKVAPAIVDRPPAPEKSLEQKPLLRSFLVDPNQGGKVMDKFYSEKEKLTEEKASNKLNEITFGGTKKKPIYLEGDKQRLLDKLTDASGDVSDINKEIRAIEKEMSLTPKKKREKIDRLIAERMKVIKGVMP